MILGTALLIVLLMSNGANPLPGALPTDFQKRLDHVIPEPARADRAVAEWKALQKDAIDFSKEVRTLTDRLLVADDDRRAGAAALEAMLGQLEPARAAAQARALDRLLAIRGNMSAEEWAAIFGDAATPETK
jgi:hypothetical protein